jgi:hypothetical protein
MERPDDMIGEMQQVGEADLCFQDARSGPSDRPRKPVRVDVGGKRPRKAGDEDMQRP